jgi:hypothetical protein
VENNFVFFNNLFKNLDDSLTRFNSNIFFNKINFNSEFHNYDLQNESIQSENEQNFNKTELDNNYFYNLINNYIKKRKTNCNYDKIPLLKETIEFRYKFLSNLLNYKNKNNGLNISNSQKDSLLKFYKNKPFMVLQCDKNVGSIIISNEDFLNIANNYLNENKKTYIQLNEDPLKDIIKNINNKLKELYNNKHISSKLYKKLQIKENFNCKNGSLRILPKIHKDKFGIRPIINSINHPTSKLCEFIDIILKPIIEQCDTIIKDSQELLQIGNNLEFKNDVFIYSGEFESLYPNIDPNDATAKISDFMKKYLFNNIHVTIMGFIEILKLIFSNGTFIFNKKFYIQIIGLPMGCICGPTIANLYLFILEKHWVSINKNLIYKRFIDDIIIISITPVNLNDLRKQFIYLKLNIVCDKIVIFLDLKIKFDKSKKITILSHTIFNFK